MFDTVGIRYLNSLPPLFLDKWDIEKKRTDTFEHHFIFKKSVIHATYHKYGFNNQTPMLNLYTSLPKLLHKCNHTMVNMSELPDAFSVFNDFLSSVPEFTDLDAVERTRLVRVDACHNFNVGHDLNDYLHVAKGVDISRRKKTIYKTGVHHRSDDETICVYDKHAECGHTEAKNVLRVEISIRSKDRVEKEIGSQYPTLLDLNKGLSIRMMNSALYGLKLDKCIAYNLPDLEKKVVQLLGSGALSRNIIHYIRDKNKLDPQNLSCMYSRATKKNYEDKLREIGIVSTSLERDKTLHPLSIC